VDDLECGEDGPCGDVLGGGVTAAPASDPSGETLYLASVGCYTGPRVGYADRLFRVRAADGAIEWAEPDFPGEPFGAAPFNDYGFLNGPILVPGAEPTVVGASKDGKVYARDAATGAERWTTVVGDVSAAQNQFAGFGLFNGAPALAEGRLFASLNQFLDGTPAGVVHTQAFDAASGASAWLASVDVGPTWGSVSAAGGVVFVGTSNLSPLTAAELHAFDAEDGAALQVFALPSQTASGPSVVGDQLFVGYGLGLLGPVPSGVRAYALR
jgi:outer membrane protein assembly factor BamB